MTINIDSTNGMKLAFGVFQLAALGIANVAIGVNYIHSMDETDTETGSRAKLVKGVLHTGVGYMNVRCGADFITDALTKF